MVSVWGELKRRNVVKVAVAYAIVGWVLVEVASTILPTFEAPQWVIQTITFIIILGFPLALIFAWAFELTSEGIKPAKAVASSESITQVTAKEKTTLTAEEPSKLTPVPTEQSIAVLPFVNMSPDPDQEYFSDGIAEELLNQLTKLRGLHVAGRTSSFYFKGKNEDFRVIGEKLNVAHILEGSVRKADNRVRITAQLVKAADGYHLWSETFDRDLDDIFAIQDETARAVADVLSITLGVGDVDLGAGSTRNFAAYDAYLAALALRDQEGRENYTGAIEQFEKAVQLDPEFANAWGELAIAYWLAGELFIPERAGELSDKADHAARCAAKIAPDAVSSLRALAVLHMRNREWLAAEARCERALEVAPTDSAGIQRNSEFFLYVGRPREALQYQQRAVRAEPLSVHAARMLGHVFEITGDLDEALAQYRQAEALPGDHGGALHGPTAVVAMEMGDHALLREIVQKMVDADTLPAANNALTTTMQELLESPEEARVELRRFYRDPAFNYPLTRVVIAVWASYFGDHELALEAFHGQIQTSFLSWLVIWRPVHKEMRRLPGFKDLVRDLGLVDYWRSTGKWGDFCRPIGDDDFECE